MKKHGFVFRYLRVFLNYCLTFSASNVLIYLIMNISGRGNLMNAYVILLCSSVFSIFTCDRYAYMKKSISIDDMQLTIKRIESTMVKMKWNIEDDSERIKVFTPRFQLWFWKDRIRFYLTDMEVYISGPKEYVDRVIQLSKFPYAAFDITEVEEQNV